MGDRRRTQTKQQQQQRPLIPPLVLIVGIVIIIALGLLLVLVFLNSEDLQAGIFNRRDLCSNRIMIREDIDPILLNELSKGESSLMLDLLNALVDENKTLRQNAKDELEKVLTLDAPFFTLTNSQVALIGPTEVSDFIDSLGVNSTTLNFNQIVINNAAVTDDQVKVTIYLDITTVIQFLVPGPPQDEIVAQLFNIIFKINIEESDEFGCLINRLRMFWHPEIPTNNTI